MDATDDSRELTILESKGILIKDQLYDGVLTNHRIILTGYVDQKPRSLIYKDLKKIELDTSESGDPVITIFLPSVAGDTKKVILRFTQQNFPDPHQVRLLWYSEINKKIQPTMPVSSKDIPKKDSVTQAFCVKCGTKFVDGSVFCNKCGTQIIYPAEPLPVEQKVEPIQQKDATQKISPVPGETSPKKTSSPIAVDSKTEEKVPFIAPMHKEPQKKKSFFAGSGTRRPTVIVVSALVGVIVLIAVFFVAVPSASHGFDLTSSGLNLTTPEVKDTASPANPVVSLTSSSKTTRTSETTVQTRAPVQTTTPLQTSTTPVQTITQDVSSVQPTLTSAPGDPATVLISYPSFFNAGNGTGLYALLSENIKSNYPLDMVNTELATARTNGYSINKIQVNDQITEGSSAILLVEISWDIGGSPINSSPNVPLVYENSQWKLDTLIISP